ncbi:MAG: ThuA domain-containing protein [Verrucomicrobiae bacterium]|nr:ThuA domain-containing protein [Verrucomicrobiae bacterium]
MTRFLGLLILFATLSGPVLRAEDSTKIVLVAGEVKEVDRVGHHDYLGGCRLMEALLRQTTGVEPILIQEGWPSDPTLFDGAKAVVFYTDGAGKQAYLASPDRLAKIQQLVEIGAGVVSLHQAVEFSPPFAKQSMAWIGGLYTPLSSRGHWDSVHDSFPEHPATRGVTPWSIKDGWLNHFQFPAGMKGVTPLVWSGKEKQGSPEGGSPDVVAWAFKRPDGGRSFSFSGLDAHSAWENEGMRRLVINGILWSAGLEVPETGAPCDADKATIDSFLTPRTAPPAKGKKS